LVYSEIKKNSNHIVEIAGMTHEGLGVGRIDNFAVFVDGAIKGETVEIKIIKVSKNYAVGKLMKILKPSENRIDPICPVFKRCGGCSLQHMDYKAQLDFKTDLVRENLKRIGRLDDVIIHDTIGMNNYMNYRNKAQYPVEEVKGKPVIGFYAKRSHDVIEHDCCDIQDIVSVKIKKIIHKFIVENNISVYNESTGEGIVRHIMTRVGFKTGEVMVVIVINGDDLPMKVKKRLVEILTEKVPEVKSIYLNVNKKITNTILGDTNKLIYGKEVISDFIGDLEFRVSPLSFFQVNPVQTEVLYNKALEYAGLTGNETVFDLYCGIGTISLFLSQKAKKVYGVEVVEEAIRDARENARINGVNNAEFFVGKAEEVVPVIYDRGVKADVVVVDPPRKGCDQALLDTLVEMQPERIVYVSCNPSTLARDLGYLSERGYKALEAQPVDMFPQTHHVECVIGMQRKDT